MFSIEPRISKRNEFFSEKINSFSYFLDPALLTLVNISMPYCFNTAKLDASVGEKHQHVPRSSAAKQEGEDVRRDHLDGTLSMLVDVLSRINRIENFILFKLFLPRGCSCWIFSRCVQDKKCLKKGGTCTSKLGPGNPYYLGPCGTSKGFSCIGCKGCTPRKLLAENENGGEENILLTMTKN